MMGFKRQLRKEYNLGYNEGLADIPLRIGPFFARIDDVPLKDAYLRGWQDGQRERRNRREWHSKANAASPMYTPPSALTVNERLDRAMPQPGEPTMPLMETERGLAFEEGPHD